ncbi:hypothetical protein GGR26_002970 [Lewinella marina]|uniref:Uncharacterized protein n=1 Tax=Neolewinella marina TaxID=438751 RepID=A0A2G0CAT2_9BACT|nr:hypothetical protein [Neolewinella marina]NJB87193.1 hypothetical protein [Neolewinella marina]PHK97074.1 hypothetical protein CGL56_17810 [Neolewinella marina]
MKVSKIAWLAAILLAITVAYFAWYHYTFSMGQTTGYEVNTPAAEKSLLIATQDSPFKRNLTTQLVERLDTSALFIRVVDVTELATYKCFELDGGYAYDAVVIMHTWEYGREPRAVTDFLRSVECDGIIYVLTTSGSGVGRLPDYDGMSAASLHGEIPTALEATEQWVRRTLWQEGLPETAAGGLAGAGNGPE